MQESNRRKGTKTRKSNGFPQGHNAFMTNTQDFDRKNLQYIQKDSQQIWRIQSILDTENLLTVWHETRITCLRNSNYWRWAECSAFHVFHRWCDVVVKYQSIEYSTLRIHAWYLPYIYNYINIRISIFLSISLPSKSANLIEASTKGCDCGTKRLALWNCWHSKLEYANYIMYTMRKSQKKSTLKFSKSFPASICRFCSFNLSLAWNQLDITASVTSHPTWWLMSWSECDQSLDVPSPLGSWVRKSAGDENRSCLCQQQAAVERVSSSA